MKSEYLKIAIAIVIAYALWRAIKSVLDVVGVTESRAEKDTIKAPKESVELVKKEIEENAKKIKASTGLTAAQKKLITPTYSQSQYKTYADRLFEAMNGTGTDTDAITTVFSNMKNRGDVLNLIAAYGVKQLTNLGINDGPASNLVGHLQSENGINAAQKGLDKNKVYYNF